MPRKAAESSGSSTKIVIRKDQMGARPANFARPRLPSSDSESEVDDGRLNSEELEDDAESERSESESYEEESPEVSEEEQEDVASLQEPESMLPLLSKRNRGLRSNLSSIEAQEVLHLHATGNKKVLSSEKKEAESYRGRNADQEKRARRKETPPSSQNPRGEENLRDGENPERKLNRKPVRKASSSRQSSKSRSFDPKGLTTPLPSNTSTDPASKAIFWSSLGEKSSKRP